jgi:hypothetical protein
MPRSGSWPAERRRRELTASADHCRMPASFAAARDHQPPVSCELTVRKIVRLHRNGTARPF